MPYKVGKDGLIVDTQDNRLVATLVDNFVTSLGSGAQADWVILRLHHLYWAKAGPIVPPNRIHQFAIPSQEARKLGQALLEYAAQAEKEGKGQPDH